MFSGLSYLLLALVIVMACTPTIEACTQDYFTAAVFDHARQGEGTNMTPQSIVEANLEFYRKAARIAKFKGADLILFPEYGIFPASDKRENMKRFLENIPDPKTTYVNPCEEPEAYSTRPILYCLSCMAKENDIVVVANTGDIQPCEGHPKCPKDGVFHFNTNVVFDKDGKLLARYYKERLYFEFGMDLPIEEQDPTFETDCGSFATFTCFDIVFKKMSEYSRNPGIDAILFPSMWINSSPQYTSVPYWQSFAIGNDATLLASNIQIPGHFSGGSGIFHGCEGTLAYTFNPDGISKVVISKVPRLTPGYQIAYENSNSITAITKNGSMEFKNDGKDMPDECSYRMLGDSKNVYNDYRCYDTNTTMYTLTKLTDPEGHVEACSNGMCCSLDYTANGMEEEFYLGVFNGTLMPYLRYLWAEENCFLARCDEFEEQPCTTFPMTSKTLFYKVHMKANFTTSYVYPTVAKNKMRPISKDDWSYSISQESTYEGVIDFESLSGERLLVVGLKGRNFDRDPVYKQ